MREMRLYVMYAGRINLPNKGHMTPGSGVGEAVSMPVYTYLIEHPEGLVLVDTGQRQGGPAVVEKEDQVLSRLSQLGYGAEDIDYVIMTHLHVDHTGYMTEFPNAVFVVRKEELRAAWWPERCEGGYVYEHYRDTRGYRYLEPEDGEDLDLFMDGSVICIDTKGHSRGHQSVIVKLENAGNIVLVGDAASFQENLDSWIQPGVCTNNWDAMRSLKRLDFLRARGYKLFFGHDPYQEKELKMSPEFYD